MVLSPIAPLILAPTTALVARSILTASALLSFALTSAGTLSALLICSYRLVVAGLEYATTSPPSAPAYLTYATAV